MKVINTNEVKVGMIAAAPITNAQGELIADKGTVLTKQIIARLNVYGIQTLRIVSGNDAKEEKPEASANHIEKGNVQEPTYSQKIKRSPEFQRFQFDYTLSVDVLKTRFSTLFSTDGTFDKESLFQTVLPLLDEIHNSIEMFDMLHNMRSVKDSIYAHSLNVALISGMFGKWLNLPKEDLDVLILAALLHDIGKTKIPTEILEKPGKYTEEEFATVKKHPQLGFELLDSIPDTVLDPRVKKSALMHHERCDGSGYPDGLEGDAIEDFSQIIAIADVYDAMTAARPYHAPQCPFQVIEAFEKVGLQKYKPKYILTFLEHIATTYQSNRVLLNDGRGGNIVYLNKHALSKPIVQLDDGSCVDLSCTPELHIQSLL